MRYDLLTFLLAGACAAAAPVAAQTLHDRLNAAQAANKTEVHIACGKLEKSNCAQVLPRLAEQTTPSGVTLVPEETTGSTESVTAICMGLVDGAIAQRDAADLRARKPDCVGKIEGVGKPLYPYYGYLVIAASAPYDTLARLVSNTPETKVLNIAVGEDGSGGAVTMAAMLKADPSWRRVVKTQPYGLDTALDRIKGGTLDGFFVMDAPGSPLIDQIASAKDAKGNQLFKFADVRPNDDFYKVTDWSGRTLYQEVVVTPGTFRSTKSVSVDAMLVVANAFRENRAKNGPKAVASLTDATDQASPAILADTHTPRGWVPASAKK